MPLHAGVLATILPYGPALSEHCILQAKLEPGRSPNQQPVSAGELEQLMASVRSWEAWLDSLKDTAPKGYISYKPAGDLTITCPSKQCTSMHSPSCGVWCAQISSGSGLGPSDTCQQLAAVWTCRVESSDTCGIASVNTLITGHPTWSGQEQP